MCNLLLAAAEENLTQRPRKESTGLRSCTRFPVFSSLSTSYVFFNLDGVAVKPTNQTPPLESILVEAYVQMLVDCGMLSGRSVV